MLLESNEIITNPATCAETFNEFFIDVIKNLDIDRTLHTDTTIDNNDTVENTIKKFKNHPSVLRILEEGHVEKHFSFDPISESDIRIVINKIDPSKAFQIENILPKVLKENADICSMTVLSDINKCIRNGKFPNNLKYPI